MLSPVGCGNLALGNIHTLGEHTHTHTHTQILRLHGLNSTMVCKCKIVFSYGDWVLIKAYSGHTLKLYFIAPNETKICLFSIISTDVVGYYNN